MYVNTPKFGSPAKFEPSFAAADRARIVEESLSSARLSKMEPRIIQGCVQCIANLACDNEPGPDGQSTVDKIVLAGAVTVLGFVMNSHLDKVGVVCIAVGRSSDWLCEFVCKVACMASLH